MKKILSLVGAALVAMSMSAQTINFNDFAGGTSGSFGSGDFTMTIGGTTGWNGSHSTTSKRYFGATTSGSTGITGMISTGGGVNGKDRSLVINSTYNGTLTLYVCSSSSSAERTVTVADSTLSTQNLGKDANNKDVYKPLVFPLTGGETSVTVSGGIYLYQVSFESNGTRPAVTTTWDFKDLYNADPAVLDSVNADASKKYFKAVGGAYSYLWNNIAIVNNTSKYMECSPNNKSFDGGVSGTYRVNLNGGSFPTPAEGETAPAMPTQRFFTFAVNGPSTIKVYCVSGGSGDRICYISDGTNILTSFTATASSTNNIVTAEYTGEAGNIYVYADKSYNFYVISATNVGTTVQPVDPSIPTAIEPVTSSTKVVKTLVNGQVVIIRDGVRYNALGARL